MANNTNRIELTEKQLEESILPLNHVMVEMVHNNDYHTTKSGIIVGLPDRKTYNDNATCADMQENWGIVYKLPERLYFDLKSHDSMDWEVEDMEVRVGDKVWFSIVEAANAQEITCGERLFKVLFYQSMYVIKRDVSKDGNKINIYDFDEVGQTTAYDNKHKLTTVIDYTPGAEIIPLNGYLLCQTLNCKKISELDVISESKIDKTRVLVRYVGKPNLRYKTKGYTDHQNVQPGDEVILAPRCPLVYLERKRFFAEFSDDELFLVVPRKKVFLVINRESNNE